MQIWISKREYKVLCYRCHETWYISTTMVINLKKWKDFQSDKLAEFHAGPCCRIKWPRPRHLLSQGHWSGSRVQSVLCLVNCLWPHSSDWIPTLSLGIHRLSPGFGNWVSAFFLPVFRDWAPTVLPFAHGLLVTVPSSQLPAAPCPWVAFHCY